MNDDSSCDAGTGTAGDSLAGYPSPPLGLGGKTEDGRAGETHPRPCTENVGENTRAPPEETVEFFNALNGKGENAYRKEQSTFGRIRAGGR